MKVPPQHCFYAKCFEPPFKRNACRAHYESRIEVVKPVVVRPKIEPEPGMPSEPNRFDYQRLDGLPRPYADLTDSQYQQWVRGNLAWRYRMTARDWLALFEAQGRCCAVCQDPAARQWCVDHDRSCCAEKRSCGLCIRGILCSGCNFGLGHFKDRPQSLLQAVQYLADNRSTWTSLQAESESVSKRN